MLPRIFVLAILLTSMRTHVASADDALPKPTSESAIKHFEEGKKHFFNREWKEAAVEFKAARNDQPLPIFDYNLAQTYRQLGDYDAAIWHYEHFLQAYTIAGRFRTTAETNLAEMKDKRAKASAVVPPTVVPTPTSEPAKRDPERPRPAVEKWYEDWFGWGLVGAGVAGLAVGGGFLVSASNLDDQANHTANQQDANALHDKAGSRSLLGAAIGIAGAAVAITGAIKLAIHSDANPDTSISLGVSSNGAFVFGRF